MATTSDAMSSKNATLTFAATDISGSSNYVSFNPEVDVSEFAVFGDDWAYNVASLQRFTGEIRVVFTETADEGYDELWTAWDSMAAVAFQVDPKGSGTASNWRFTGSVIVTSAPVELDRQGGVVLVSAPYVGHGSLTKGTVGS